ncbi:MAG: hypothetical protein MUE71_03955 [Chitinophagaceae bacterium]|nr:hypothetical protein [Chitinophagaceae bacterium]
MVIVYRILSYILLPFGAILGFLTIITLFASLANPTGLLPAFLCGATVIYLITSFNFLHKSMLGGLQSKPSLFDWIRVNGFVALALGALFVFQSIYFRNNNMINEQLQAQMDEMASQMPDAEMPDLNKIIKWVLNFMLVSGSLLIAHTLLTLNFLKKYPHLFGKKQPD